MMLMRYSQCFRHGFVETTPAGKCALCEQFDLNTEKIRAERVKLKNVKFCRLFGSSIQKMARGLRYQQNIQDIQLGTGVVVFQLVTVNRMGDDDRNYGNKSYFRNIPIYQKLHELHNDGMVYWNYGDPVKELHKSNSSPSLVVGFKQTLLTFFKNSLFKLTELLLDPKEVILFQGRTLGSYVQKFGSVFA